MITAHDDQTLENVADFLKREVLTGNDVSGAYYGGGKSGIELMFQKLSVDATKTGVQYYTKGGSQLRAAVVHSSTTGPLVFLVDEIDSTTSAMKYIECKDDMIVYREVRVATSTLDKMFGVGHLVKAITTGVDPDRLMTCIQACNQGHTRYLTYGAPGNWYKVIEMQFHEVEVVT